MAVTDDAIEKIKSMIISGELKPGDRLPIEKDLANRLGLSRNSMREAIRALSSLRVLETRQGAGTFVTSLAPGLVLEAVSFIVNLHDQRAAIDFLEVRRILESEATARAASRMSAAQLDEIRRLNEQIRAISTAEPIDTTQLIAIDREFHAAITAACGNPALAALTDMLGGQTAPARGFRVAASADTASAAIREHDEIIAALAAGDTERARLRSSVHVLGLEDWLSQRIPPAVGG